MPNTFDVIVVGAGYIGSSVAYQLCAQGLKAALLDRGSMAAGASRANYGNIQIQDMELENSRQLIKTARTRFARLEEDLDRKVGLREIGGLLLIENENQWKMMQARLEVLHSEGIHSELVTADRLREIEPLIDASHLLGGLFHSGEGQIDPFQLVWGYLVQARRRGLREFYFNEVTGFDIVGGRLRGVMTPHGLYSAPVVVLCSGAGTRRLGHMLGREWDIPYTLGQAMVTEPIGPAHRSHVSSASFFEQEASGESGEVKVGLAISQSRHGHLLLGEAMLDADQINHPVPAQSLPAIAACVSRYFPSFRRLRVLRGWSAAVAYTRDSCPWLGPVPGIEGLLLATAFRSTVIITPLVGELVAQLVLHGECDLAIDDFLPERESSHALQ